MKLKDKVALITGGNSGIGLAAARLFCAEGASVAITGRNQTTMGAAIAELGPSARAYAADMTDVPSIESAIACAARDFGKLDVVFANAGMSSATPVGHTPLNVFEEIVRTNLTGVFFTVQAAAPYLNRGASIILNGSVHSVLGAPRYSAYAASKAGVWAMTRVLAAEFSPLGIRVNMVRIGATRTPMWSSAAPTPEVLAGLETRIERSIPLGRFGTAEEVAKAVLFLASDDASNIQAAEIAVDGGTSGAPLGAPVYRPETP